MGATPRLIPPRVVLDTNVLVSALLFRRIICPLAAPY